MLTENGAGFDVLNAVLFHEKSTLGTLAAAVGAKNQNIHQNPLALSRVNAPGVPSRRASCVDAPGIHAERRHHSDARSHG